MTGQTVNGWYVIRRAANVNGNSRWLCRHTCEQPAEVIQEGIKIRGAPLKYCDNCRPKRPGTVQRKQKAC